MKIIACFMFVFSCLLKLELFVWFCVCVCFVIAVLLGIKKGVCLLGQEYAMKLILCVDPLLPAICTMRTMEKNSSKSSW